MSKIIKTGTNLLITATVLLGLTVLSDKTLSLKEELNDYLTASSLQMDYEKSPDKYRNFITKDLQSGTYISLNSEMSIVPKSAHDSEGSRILYNAFYKTSLDFNPPDLLASVGVLLSWLAIGLLTFFVIRNKSASLKWYDKNRKLIVTPIVILATLTLLYYLNESWYPKCFYGTITHKFDSNPVKIKLYDEDSGIVRYINEGHSLDFATIRDEVEIKDSISCDEYSKK